MFVLHEDKLREALADDKNDLFAFDPMKVSADQLHIFIDKAEDQGVIGRGDPLVSISIYPLTEKHPKPLVAIQTSRSSIIGGGIRFETGLNDEEGTVATVRRIVEVAETLYETEAQEHHELDRLAAMLNEDADEGEEWDHAEICNELVKALRRTGRVVRLDDD